MTSDYYPVSASEDFLRFDFDSVGPRGIIRKAIIYSPLPSNPDVYNLGFGDLLADGGIDDLVVSDNGDMEDVLGTVARTIELFLRNYPTRKIFLTGSTDIRTRLYRIAIAKSLTIIADSFHILGIRNEGVEPFVKGVKYEGFLIMNP